jgi:PiT family inorganic phosphate transporter
MGIITVLLYSTGYLHGEFEVPHWVAISCYVAIALGTLSGGWKIIETMGSRITKLSQHQGFSASLGGIDHGVRGIAAGHPGLDDPHDHRLHHRCGHRAKRASAVRWGVAGNVVVAWLITIPASAAVGAIFYLLTRILPRQGEVAPKATEGEESQTAWDVLRILPLRQLR